MNLQSNIHLQLKQVVNDTSPEQVKDDSKVKCITEPDVPKCEVGISNSTSNWEYNTLQSYLDMGSI